MGRTAQAKSIKSDADRPDGLRGLCRHTVGSSLVQVRRSPGLRLAGVGLVLSAIATAGLAASGGGAQAAPDAAARAVVEAARKELGDAYQWGGNGPDAYDCSGLTSALWRRAGAKDMPRVSRDQQKWAWPISQADARPGDLVFIGDPVTHVGIYIGDGRMIDASSSRKKIVERAIWTSDGVRYGRVPRAGVARPKPPAAPKPTPSATTKPSTKPTPVAKPTPSATAKPTPSSTAKPKPSASAKPAPSATGTPAPKPSTSPKPKPKPTATSTTAPHQPIPPAGHQAKSSAWADRIVAAATRQLGAKWQQKGTGPRYDAAGLVRWAVKSVDGRVLPDTPAALEKLTTPVAIKDLRVGDLVFYGKPAVHVAIYIGNGEMIDASKVLEKVVRRRVFSSETVRFARLK